MKAQNPLWISRKKKPGSLPYRRKEARVVHQPPLPLELLSGSGYMTI
jgi:hypothetical protein